MKAWNKQNGFPNQQSKQAHHLVTDHIHITVPKPASALKRSLQLIICSVLLAACAVGPVFDTPETSQTASYSTELSKEQPLKQLNLVRDKDIPAQWWRLFESEALNTLIQQALDSNPGLEAAKARLRVSRENLQAETSSLLFPAVDASAKSSRQKISGTAFGGRSNIFTLHNASVDVAYSVDIFGGGRRFLESVEAQVEFDSFQLEAAYLTLTSNIVTTTITEASLRAQLIATNEIIAAEEKQLQVTEQRFELGVIAKAELLSQRTAVARSRTQLPPLQKALAQSRHQLAILLGQHPGESELPEFELKLLHMPKAIPLTLPSTLTRQRPDIRAAEALLHQASAQIGIATANLYPKITLSGSYGSEATKVSDLFSSGSAVWNLGAGILQPVFRGGELRARQRAAVASYEQAQAQYKETVLLAFRHVADVLLALQTDMDNLSLQQESKDLSTQTLQLVQLQFKEGAVSYLGLLNAQTQYQQSRIAHIQARSLLFTDTAALFQALGGGWWNRQDMNNPEAESSKSGSNDISKAQVEK
jgi:NodT family efflux transporter outer membrane factor (OMF) lipoprotein